MPANQPLIRHARPTLGEAELHAVQAVLERRHLAPGPEVRELETDLARAAGRRHAVATSSGTAALHVALLALGLGQGDRVLVPSYSCVALVQAVGYVGGEVVLVDSAPGAHNLDVDKASRMEARAVIVPHMFGTPADVRPLMKAGLVVVEDVAHALGASLQGRPAGGRGDACITSFYATKLLAAGQGGGAVFRTRKAWQEAMDLCSMDEQATYRVRYNYRLADLAAAVARVQLARLPELLAQRARIAATYREALANVPGVRVPAAQPGATCYRFVVRIARNRLEPVLHAMRAAGVEARRPVYLPLHRYLRQSVRRFPHAEKAWQETLSLPVYPELESREVLQVVRVLKKALNA